MIPRCCVIIFTSYNVGELILGLTSFLLIDLCSKPSVLAFFERGILFGKVMRGSD